MHVDCEAECARYQKLVAEMTRKLAKSREQYNEMVDIAANYQRQNAELRAMLVEAFSVVKRQAG